MIIDYDYDERYKNSGAMQNQDKKKQMCTMMPQYVYVLIKHTT